MFRGVWAAAALMGSAVSAHAPQPTSLVGTWKLISANAVSAKGEPIARPFGESPSGEVTYTREGRVSVIISHGGRRLLSADRIAAPMAEKADAFSSFFAYAQKRDIFYNNAARFLRLKTSRAR